MTRLKDQANSLFEEAKYKESITFLPVFKALAGAFLLFTPCCINPAPIAAQSLTTLTSFAGPNGSYPLAGLTKGNDGNFYGTTFSGGTFGAGTVFRMTPSGQITTLVNFNVSNGSQPYSKLLLASDGNFYGVTEFGGSAQKGTVYRMTPSGNLTTLINFNGTNGANPYSAALIQGKDGYLYGTAYRGGEFGYGTVYRLTLNGVLTIMHSFNNSDGANPNCALVQATDGNFYGTASYGGVSSTCFLGAGCGTIFRMTPNGDFTNLYNFDATNGITPQQLIQANDGNFYSTAFNGGDYNVGVVFRITPSGSLTTLASFNFSNGANPFGAMVQGSDNNLYGTTFYGGSLKKGTIFRVTLDGVFTTMVNFKNTNGANPRAQLLQDGQRFYSTTNTGGSSGVGTVYKFNPFLPAVAGFSPTKGPVGTSVAIQGVNFTNTKVVQFNGVSSTFVVNSDTLITVQVPPGATTGTITIGTSNGVATSSAKFTITP
jgi:uncharacterized repeat protein (TIGR03803 family)